MQLVGYLFAEIPSRRDDSGEETRDNSENSVSNKRSVEEITHTGRRGKISVVIWQSYLWQPMPPALGCIKHSRGVAAP